MNTKAWYKSKTKWGAILGALAILLPDPTNPKNWTEAISIILIGFGLRDAIKP